MLPIIRKSLPLLLSHLATFVFLGIGPFLGRSDSVAVMSMLFPLWMSSTILWVEFGESEPFLRILPITNREVARIKFTLSFCFMCVCGLVQLGVATLTGILAVDPGITITLIALSSSIGLLFGAVGYLAIWLVGVKPMIPVYIVFHVGTAISVAVLLDRYMPRLDRMPVLRMVDGIPWFAALIVLAIAVTGYFALVDVGARVRRLEHWN